jgi:hypothetical protein
MDGINKIGRSDTPTARHIERESGLATKRRKTTQKKAFNGGDIRN